MFYEALGLAVFKAHGQVIAGFKLLDRAHYGPDYSATIHDPAIRLHADGGLPRRMADNGVAAVHGGQRAQLFELTGGHNELLPTIDQ